MSGMPLLLALFWIAWLIGCNGSPTTTPPRATPATESSSTPQGPNSGESAGIPWRWVTSGWVAPRVQPPGTFTQELRSFVIADQKQMEEFFGSLYTYRTRGETVGRVDFEKSILLAAYYVWRPMQGEPLFFVGLKADGNTVTVKLELSDIPQGREQPYLLAPLKVIAVDRSGLPKGQSVAFAFQLNGQPVSRIVTTLN